MCALQNMLICDLKKFEIVIKFVTISHIRCYMSTSYKTNKIDHISLIYIHRLQVTHFIDYIVQLIDQYQQMINQFLKTVVKSQVILCVCVCVYNWSHAIGSILQFTGCSLIVAFKKFDTLCRQLLICSLRRVASFN